MDCVAAVLACSAIHWLQENQANQTAEPHDAEQCGTADSHCMAPVYIGHPGCELAGRSGMLCSPEQPGGQPACVSSQSGTDGKPAFVAPSAALGGWLPLVHVHAWLGLGNGHAVMQAYDIRRSAWDHALALAFCHLNW